MKRQKQRLGLEERQFRLPPVAALKVPKTRDEEVLVVEMAVDLQGLAVLHIVSMRDMRNCLRIVTYEEELDLCSFQ